MAKNSNELNMKNQFAIFAAVITHDKIRAAIAAHPDEYASFIAKENAKKQAKEVEAAKRRRVSRKTAG